MRPGVLWCGRVLGRCCSAGVEGAVAAVGDLSGSDVMGMGVVQADEG